MVLQRQRKQLFQSGRLGRICNDLIPDLFGRMAALRISGSLLCCFQTIFASVVVLMGE